MPNFLSQLTKAEQARLLEELNYMNLDEIRGFCFPRGIPYKVVVEYSNGKIRATKDTDRKPIILARVRRYLTTGEVGEASCIPVGIVREDKPPGRLGPRDRDVRLLAVAEAHALRRLLLYQLALRGGHDHPDRGHHLPGRSEGWPGTGA